MEEAAEARIRAKQPAPSPEHLERERKRDLLLLSRTRLLHQIEESTHERYRQMLELALQDIDKRIAEL
jgi:hypothetical protein